MRAHYTGEVVEPTPAQKEEDKVLGSFPSRASIWKIMLMSLKVFWPIYGLIFFMLVFTLVFTIGMFADDILMIEALPLVAIFFLVTIIVPLMLSLTFLQIRNDRVEVTKSSVRVFHHYMTNMLMVYNSIDISDIKSVRVAGKDYVNERKRRTKLLDRLGTNPKAPPGGLHFLFHDPKALLIIEMVRPVPIVNLSIIIDKRSSWGPSLKRVYVKEVIIEVDRKYHNEFISLMKELIEEEKDTVNKKENFLATSSEFRTRIEKKGLKLSDLN